MEKIWNILDSALSKYNLWKASFSLMVSWRCKKHLVDFFWDWVLKNIDIEKVKNWIVHIKAKNPSWAQEVQLVSNDLLINLKEDFNNENIISIRVYS